MINEKISETKNFFQEKRVLLKKNYAVMKQLIDLKEYINASKIERISSGVAQICEECGRLKKDCCGKGIELRYSKELLIINMLLGVDLPETYLFSDKCYFLTNKGCLLLARDVFCVNYLCKSIRDSISIERFKKLQELEEKELQTCFKLQELLKSIR
jgi:hypothetical protein